MPSDPWDRLADQVYTRQLKVAWTMFACGMVCGLFLAIGLVGVATAALFIASFVGGALLFVWIAIDIFRNPPPRVTDEELRRAISGDGDGDASS